MRLQLKQHPNTPDNAVSSIEVEASRPEPCALRLRFVVGGDISRVLWPAPTASARADDLWKHTCFEAFVKGGQDEAYCEFNLSPSGQWAAYSFDGYRTGMRALDGVELRDLFRDPDDGRYEMEATLDLDRSGLRADRPWTLALSAVIEEASGDKSYWAMAHPPGKPDFHHPESFILVLRATDVP
jgi:hypothetical protein